MKKTLLHFLPFPTARVTPFIGLGFAASSMLVRAVDYTWDGSDSNDWATATNWVGDAVPASGTGTRIQVGTGTVSVDYAHRLIYSAAQGEITFTGGTSNRALIIGNVGTGHMEISGGTFISTSTTADGMAAGGGNGYLYLTGGTYQKTASTVSGNGAGTFALLINTGTALVRIDSGLFAATTLDFQNGAGNATTTGTIQLNGGTLSVGYFVESSTTFGTHTVNLNGGTVASRNNATWADLINTSWVLQSHSTFNIAHSVSFAEGLSGSGGFTKTGTGNFTLSGNSTYSGVTTVSEGILTVSNNNALGASGAGNNTVVSNGARLVLANGITVSGESLTIAGSGGNNLGGLQVAANGTAIWDGAITVTGTDSRIGAQTGGNLTLRGAIDGTASNLIIRSDGSTASTDADFNSTIVNLEGAYTGSQLLLYQGVLKLGASERIQDTAVVNLGTTASTSVRQRFDLNGYSETIAGLTVTGSAASSTHEVTNSSTTLSTLTLNSTTSREFSGIITGNLAIQKLGTNTVTFSGLNTYSGVTSVNAGTLSVTSAGALNGGGSVTVANTATFNLLGAFLFNIGANGVNNSITGTGTAHLNGTLNLNLASAAIANGNTWNLVGVSGFSLIDWTNVQVTSTAGSFSKVANLWTLVDGDHTWTLSETTGVLSLAVVPEPSQAMLLLLGSAGFTLRRRRNGR